MKTEEQRICILCGETKPLDDFSKSYPYRCKKCVAEQARIKRAQARRPHLMEADGILKSCQMDCWHIRTETDGSLKIINIDNRSQHIAIVPETNNSIRIYPY